MVGWDLDSFDDALRWTEDGSECGGFVCVKDEISIDWCSPLEEALMMKWWQCSKIRYALSMRWSSAYRLAVYADA